ncbi:helix-turn-helix domain-containing protein [Salinicoccus albus]|uniref:helix-turn-helix domain-containing protein n=1 Tax=Salinicoccus albus TaxID=418756 RepID=UPI0003725BF7|nr:AraC family transcriptional regulator [Salinicoccus albus]
METVNFVEKFIVYIEDHLRDNIDYNQVLSNFGVEQKSFITIFSSLVGVTPYEYQQKRKMTEIAYELYTGHRRIIDIAKHYGYSDIEHFKEVYKASFGISPYETERYFRNMDLLERVSFEVVPVDKPKYRVNRRFTEGFRIVGVAKKFTLSEYNTGSRYQFLEYLNKNGIIDELLRYNNGLVKGIVLHERFVGNEIELLTGVASTLAAPFEETYTASSEFAVFESRGRARTVIEDIYRYIFRRWRFKEEKELDCSFSIEVLKSTFDIHSPDAAVQVWQALYED